MHQQFVTEYKSSTWEKHRNLKLSAINIYKKPNTFDDETNTLFLLAIVTLILIHLLVTQYRCVSWCAHAKPAWCVVTVACRSLHKLSSTKPNRERWYSYSSCTILYVLYLSRRKQTWSRQRSRALNSCWWSQGRTLRPRRRQSTAPVPDDGVPSVASKHGYAKNSEFLSQTTFIYPVKYYTVYFGWRSNFLFKS